MAVLLPGNPNYAAVARAFDRTKASGSSMAAAKCVAFGVEWQLIRDNDIVKFVSSGTQSLFERDYTSQSMGVRGPSADNLAEFSQPEDSDQSDDDE